MEVESPQCCVCCNLLECLLVGLCRCACGLLCCLLESCWPALAAEREIREANRNSRRVSTRSIVHSGKGFTAFGETRETMGLLAASFTGKPNQQCWRLGRGGVSGICLPPQ